MHECIPILDLHKVSGHTSQKFIFILLWKHNTLGYNFNIFALYPHLMKASLILISHWFLLILIHIWLFDNSTIMVKVQKYEWKIDKQPDYYIVANYDL